MTDPELKALLQELAALQSEGEPIVTMYLDTRWSSEQQRERARVLVREQAKHQLDAHDAHPQREALERTLRRAVGVAEERVDQAREGGAQGLALFACEALGLWRVVEVPRPLPSKLCTGMRPQLLPLARLFDDVEPALVAFVHAKGAQIYEVALGGIVNETTIEGPLPRSPQSGPFTPRPALGRQQVPGNERGTAEGFQYERAQKNERHHEKFADQNRRAAAEFLTTLFDREPQRTQVVLCGTGESVAAFERHLPARIASRVIGRLPRPPGKAGWNGEGRDGLLAATLEKLAEHERAVEQELVESAVGQALGGGLAVLGPEDVVLAVNERRVHRLILEEDFERSGWMCRNCNALGISHADRCSYCNGDLAWVKELGEEIASRVMADDGEVEVVPHTPRLHTYRGVAATLRQAGRRGLGMDEAHAPQA
jgi:peptide subunit release factor 1 (eRF1)